MLMTLALTGCVRPLVFAESADCSGLIDGLWEEPVADAPAPQRGKDDKETLANWIGFAGAQTAGKRTEFERAQNARAIIARCEERQRAAIEKSKPKFLGIL